jgi:hypothetical protein
LERAKVLLRYLARFSVFLTAAMMAASTDWGGGDKGQAISSLFGQDGLKEGLQVWAHLLLLLSLSAQTLTTLLLLEELALLVGRLGSLGLGEVGVVDGLGDLSEPIDSGAKISSRTSQVVAQERETETHLDLGNVNLGGSRDDVSLGDPSEGNAVDGSGSRDEQETGVELLEEDDSLSSESTGKEDEDGSGGDGGSERSRLVNEEKGKRK